MPNITDDLSTADKPVSAPVFAADAAKAAPEAPAPSAIDTLVDRWFGTEIASVAFAQEPDAWAILTKARDSLKKLLATESKS